LNLIRMPNPAESTEGEAVRALFHERFGRAPAIIASAPGRVNLIGEHTDYNGGEVLPIAIDRRTWVAVATAADGRSRAVSGNAGDSGEWTAESRGPSGGWWDYVTGVAAELAAQGAELPPVLVAVASDVPSGAGLSSSAALEVASATALASLAAFPISARDAALLGHRVETEFVGVACGIMDQFASALGSPGEALHLWCDTGNFEQVSMRDAVLIFDTGVKRSLRTAAFNARREECEAAIAMLRRRYPTLRTLAEATPLQVEEASLPSPLDRRARHVSEETRRVAAAVEGLRNTGTLQGALLYESHESLRSLYECSSRELDWFVERASAVIGVTGARLTGAGWGGCAIAVGDEDALAEAASVVAADYEAHFRLTPRTWITRASAGVRLHDSRD
jgi:galactokinase